MYTRASKDFASPGLLATSLVSLGVVGCAAMGPDYQRPDVAPPAEFRFQESPHETTSIADLPWWEVFNDKALQGLITQALAGSYDLQTAAARIEQARALVTISRSDLYPQIGYDAFATREQTFNPIERARGNILYNTFGLTVSSVWELDLWGRIRRSNESALANLFAQEDVRRGVRLALVCDVAINYFLLIELDRELAIARESNAAYKQTLDLFNQRFDAGRDSKLAVVRAQAAYDSSIADIAGLNRAIAQQENALSVLLGANPRTIERGLQLTAQVTPQTPLGETTELLRRRPDIRQAENVMISANAEIGVAVANYFPRIGLSALFGGQAPRIEDVFDSNFMVWGISGAVTGPIFQGGRLRANYHERKAFWDETIAQYRKTVLTAFRETADALVAQQTLVEQRTALESQVSSLREAVELSLSRYDGGRATYFEVLQAQQLLFPTEDALAQTQRDQLLAVVNLYKALGGGWNLDDAQWNKPR